MRAVCVIKGENIDGNIFFNQINKESPVYIEGIINGLKPGIHAFQINHFGDLTNGCVSTGGYFNPNINNKELSLISKAQPPTFTRNRRIFLGDLGNIVTNENGRTLIHIKDNLISLFGENSVIGRSIVIHDDPNELFRTGNGIYNGNNNNNLNLINGLGCGIIGIALEKSRSYL
ncbi:hypothetical protein DICPUDRAFT_43246 [Dictyostelium purpureum]|uniref:Superoxide dismutase copper/zinc binding domain-containing protein n=1 Tax=Dictyostelium purpureum TaxID=5786 RepID=F1A3R8_DICPU|nr:uncharacterized protein DICPUDRAFT_43246 [Dictyostelium purpureum]EGC29163.1 hypothetical protein DICPUDRAFT_43246 [Dictyostelium purpureum]|eukprot:XP_003294316.1 hypothetical protein DICPUDRAFT_43246 [Dictyostelium purpureum]